VSSANTTFDEVQPRRARRREMEVEPRVAQQPCLYRRGLVRGELSKDDVHFEVIRHGLSISMRKALNSSARDAGEWSRSPRRSRH